VAIELEWAAVAVDALAHVDALVGHFTRSARAHFLVTVPVAMARVHRTHAHAAWCATLLADVMTLHLRVATEQMLRIAGGNESDSFVRGTDRRVETCFRDMLDVVDVRDVACVALFAAHVEWALDTLTICGHSDDNTRRTAAAGSLPMLLDWAAATTTPQLVRRHQLPLWARIQFCHAHVLLHDAGGTTALPIILRTLHTLLTADVGDTTRQERVDDSTLDDALRLRRALACDAAREVIAILLHTYLPALMARTVLIAGAATWGRFRMHGHALFIDDGTLVLGTDTVAIAAALVSLLSADERPIPARTPADHVLCALATCCQTLIDTENGISAEKEGGVERTAAYRSDAGCDAAVTADRRDKYSSSLRYRVVVRPDARGLPPYRYSRHAAYAQPYCQQR
jgi:hypothetical protein